MALPTNIDGSYITSSLKAQDEFLGEKYFPRIKYWIHEIVLLHNEI